MDPNIVFGIVCLGCPGLGVLLVLGFFSILLVESLCRMYAKVQIVAALKDK